MRQSVIGKAKGRISDDEGLVEKLQKLMKDLKEEGQKEIKEYNESLQKKKRRFTEMLEDKGKKRAKSKKDEKKKKKKKSSSSDSKGQSSSDSNNDDDDKADSPNKRKKTRSDDPDSDGEEEQEEDCSSSSERPSNPRSPKPKEKSGKPGSQASVMSRSKTDEDLWSNKFTPASSEKETSQIGDELMEMLAEVLHSNFKSASDTCLSVGDILEFVGHKRHDDICVFVIWCVGV